MMSGGTELAGGAAGGLGYPLSAVSVRLVSDPGERARWDRVMDDGHYLGFRGMFGDGIRHVAVGPDGAWLALLGWCAGAFKVKARDAWIGWAPEQQFRRLRLVANNCRFLVLPGGRVPNLASRALALSARRLSGDMEARFGHPVLLAETFVDPSRFSGTCYRAAGWTPVGRTRGFARSGGGWRAHGRPKSVLLRPLAAGAARALAGLDEPESWGCARGEPDLPGAGRLRSLFDHLRGVPEFRSPRGVRHALPGVLAIDGKSAPLNRPGGADDARMLLAAVAHGSGVVAGQTASDSAGGEILGARRLIRELDVAGRTLTLDALHSCPETARAILDGGGDYVLPVKGNRPALLDDLRAFAPDFDAAPAATTLDKGHGRLEERTCALVPLDGRDDGLAPLPGRRQAFRVLRRRTVIKTGATTTEAVHGLTSLDPGRAGPAEILALNRGHWEIENRLHYVRDFSCDEDRSRIRTGRLPRNLACLANAAISIVRLRGRFQNQPQAQRHYAARQGDALREVTSPA